MDRLIGFWRKNFLRLEAGLGCVLGIIFGVWVKWYNGAILVDHILMSNRSPIYGSAASIFGSLLGFVIAALSIIIGYSASDKFQFLRKSSHYPTLWKVLTSNIKCLGFATMASMLGLIFDRDSAPHHVILFVFVMTSLLAIFRLARCLWVLENVVLLITKPEESKDSI